MRGGDGDRPRVRLPARPSLLHVLDPMDERVLDQVEHGIDDLLDDAGVEHDGLAAHDDANGLARRPGGFLALADEPREQGAEGNEARTADFLPQASTEMLELGQLVSRRPP